MVRRTEWLFSRLPPLCNIPSVITIVTEPCCCGKDLRDPATLRAPLGNYAKFR